jgi:hypothetical protein
MMTNRMTAYDVNLRYAGLARGVYLVALALLARAIGFLGG